MYNKRIISASIVLYKSNIDQLKKNIESFSPSNNRILYLIDNSPSKIDLQSVLSRYDNNIHYIFTGENRGYGAGHNIAIKMAIETKTNYHVVLNPDLQFNPEIIDEIADFMDDDKEIGQIMPKILSPNGDIQYLCKLLPSPTDLFLKRFLPELFSKKNAMRYQLKFTSYQEQMNIPCLSGCFMFFRISALEKIGAFDEKFFMYAEDFDITRRMYKYFKTIYYPKVTVIHEHAAESYKSIKMFFIHIINIIKYFNKWGWFFDNERKKINKNVLDELKFYRKR